MNDKHLGDCYRKNKQRRICVVNLVESVVAVDEQSVELHYLIDNNFKASFTHGSFRVFNSSISFLGAVILTVRPSLKVQ